MHMDAKIEPLPADFASRKPHIKPASLEDCFMFAVHPTTNPDRPGWELTQDVCISYDGGLLAKQHLGTDPEKVNKFFREFLQLDMEEVADLPPEVARLVPGWRTYFLVLQDGTRAGKHFHRFKKEIFTLIRGEMVVERADVYGNQDVVTIDKTRGLAMPPYIHHTVQAVASDTIFKVVANCYYDPDDARTQDTWFSEVNEGPFGKLKELYKRR